MLSDRVLGAIALYVGLALHVAAIAFSYIVAPFITAGLRFICWAARVPPLPPLTPRDVELERGK